MDTWVWIIIVIVFIIIIAVVVYFVFYPSNTSNVAIVGATTTTSSSNWWIWLIAGIFIFVIIVVIIAAFWTSSKEVPPPITVIDSTPVVPTVAPVASFAANPREIHYHEHIHESARNIEDSSNMLVNGSNSIDVLENMGGDLTSIPQARTGRNISTRRPVFSGQGSRLASNAVFDEDPRALTTVQPPTQARVIAQKGNGQIVSGTLRGPAQVRTGVVDPPPKRVQVVG